MAELYCTPDGSIWELSPHGPAGKAEFNRIGSPDNSHEDDFRPQKLREVLKYYGGTLQIYDPEEEARKATLTALHAAGWGTADVVQVRTYLSQLERRGYEVVKKAEE